MGRKILETADVSPGFRVLCLFMFIFILVGCGEDESKIRVGVSISGIAHPELRLMKLALEENAEAYGARIAYEEEEGLAELLAEGIDVLILNHSIPRNLETAVKQTHRKGIPIVILDCPPPQNLHVEAYIKVNNIDVGKMAAEHVVKEINGSGNVIVLEGPRNDEVARQITLGMYGVLEQHESIRIVASERHPDWDEKLAADTTRATLKKYAGNVQAILAGDSRLAMGAARAASENRLTGTIITVGIGANLAACRSIIAGRHDAEVDRMPYGRGLEALKLATAIAKDEDFAYYAELREDPPKIKVKYGPLRLITSEDVSLMNRAWPQLVEKR